MPPPLGPGAEGARGGVDVDVQQVHKKGVTEQARVNRTGIPLQLKRSVEERSGVPLDNVRVHYASSRPAALGALAYTQGNQVYIGPGQQRHLEHELVHVVQQKRGQVRPSAMYGGAPLNDDPALEREADAGLVRPGGAAGGAAPGNVVQRKVGFEFQTVGGDANVKHLEGGIWKKNSAHGQVLFHARDGVTVTADGSDLEYVTKAAETPEEALALGNAAADLHGKLRGYQNVGKTVTDPLEAAKVPATRQKAIEEIRGTQDAGDQVRHRGATGLRQVHPLISEPLMGIKGVCVQVGSDRYLIQGLGKTAHPQATVGVKLVAIPRLMEALTAKAAQYIRNAEGGIEEAQAPENDFLRSLTTKALVQGDSPEILQWQTNTLTTAVQKGADALQAAINKAAADAQAKGGTYQAPDDTVQQEMRSLLAILSAYNRQYSIINARQYGGANAKNAMPIMIRHSLYDIYKRIVGNDAGKKDLFRSAFDRIEWVSKDQAVGRLDRTTTAQEAVLAGEFNNDAPAPVKAQDWITKAAAPPVRRGRKITDPSGDLISARGFHSVGNIYSRSRKYKKVKDRFGLGDDPFELGLGGPGVLAELRGLERGVDYRRWGVVAKAVARMVKDVNDPPAPPTPAVTDESEPDLDSTSTGTGDTA